MEAIQELIWERCQDVAYSRKLEVSMRVSREFADYAKSANWHVRSLRVKESTVVYMVVFLGENFEVLEAAMDLAFTLSSLEARSFVSFELL